MTLSLPTYDDIARAAARLDGVAARTPVLTSRTADERTGASLFFKAETFQRTGSFKFRGAYNAVNALDPAQRSRGVLAFSSGNHAQAVALACRLHDAPSTIVMPQDAPAAKVEATRAYGADIRFYDRFREDREAIGRALAQERGFAVIPPYDHPDIVAGQGTAAKELLEDVGALDLLLTPVGGSGLLSGSALTVQALSPGCRVIGVEPEAGNDAQQSFRTGAIVRIAPPRTIADGAMTTQIGQINFAIIRKLAQDIVTVSDAQLIDTMRFFAERMKIIVEPTGCLAAAAVLNGIVPCTGLRVGIVLSGGNLDLARFSALLSAA